MYFYCNNSALWKDVVKIKLKKKKLYKKTFINSNTFNSKSLEQEHASNQPTQRNRPNSTQIDALGWFLWVGESGWVAILF